MLNRCVELRERLKAAVARAGGRTDFADGPAVFQPAESTEGLVRQGEGVGFRADSGANPDIQSLQEILIYGKRLDVAKCPNLLLHLVAHFRLPLLGAPYGCRSIAPRLQNEKLPFHNVRVIL